MNAVEKKHRIRVISRCVMSVIIAFAIGMGIGYFTSQYQIGKTAEQVAQENAERLDLKLPGETEKRTVTMNEVKAKLVEIDQLATYSGEYTVSKSVDQARYFLDDIPVLGTKNTINITCEGIVKVGYQVRDITVSVDNESKKIYISLPEPAVLDNYVIWDSVQCAETNNILNPINFEQYQKLIQEIEQDGLKEAEGQGLYDDAEQTVKKIIQNGLAGFYEYETKFM